MPRAGRRAQSSFTQASVERSAGSSAALGAVAGCLLVLKSHPERLRPVGRDLRARLGGLQAFVQDPIVTRRRIRADEKRVRLARLARAGSRETREAALGEDVRVQDTCRP